MDQASQLYRKDTVDVNDQATRDAQDLAALGHAQTLTRKFSLWSMLALAFCVLGTWSTMAQDLATGLVNGGPVGILWGLVLVTACNTCVAISLGELVSSMPTALGQAYWIQHLWNTPTGRFASYMCAWINTFGWWTLTASQIAFMTEFLLSMKLMFDPELPGTEKGWLLFVVYVGITIFFTIINYVSCRREWILPTFNNFVGVGFAGLFVAFSLALLISVGTKANLSYQSASFVFGQWINQTGWSDGVVWFLGLVQSAYGLTAFDSVIHMVEEIPAPRRNAPRTMYLAILIGALSGFIFMVVCLFSIQSVDGVLNPATGIPFIELVQSTIGQVGGAVMIALFIFNGLGQGSSVLTSASRLTWSFARDGGFPWGIWFSHVDETWMVPGRVLWLQCGIICLVGILYLFASTVLQAILSVSTIALTISYAMPIITLMVVGRDKLPPGGEFKLGRLGPVINWVSIIYCAITTVFFFFPTTPNPTVSTMNFAIAVFGVMLVLSIGFWFVQGHRTFMQPGEMAQDIQDILYAENCESSQDGSSSAEPRPDNKTKAQTSELPSD
ncbi:amino acid permease family protein, putative [Metarhizium acridum CQMa 102]|uniref:Amino acid permease family protein, putative n=1 Tax=Metarhizium acridum (strain CQMa 102) TaxID=655827 RepID=E9DXK2_METAQ|nr:amino acid permease family protein, putative [Metarhizium acridum CQMa 102]EFY91465.1 amino acid permease family protein, putative [Metarhizium acridum CQMa 102]